MEQTKEKRSINNPFKRESFYWMLAIPVVTGNALQYFEHGKLLHTHLNEAFIGSYVGLGAIFYGVRKVKSMLRKDGNVEQSTQNSL